MQSLRLHSTMQDLAAVRGIVVSTPMSVALWLALFWLVSRLTA